MGHIKVIDIWTNEDETLRQSVMYYLGDEYTPAIDDRLTRLVSREYIDEDNERMAMIDQYGNYIYEKKSKDSEMSE